MSNTYEGAKRKGVFAEIAERTRNSSFEELFLVLMTIGAFTAGGATVGGIVGGPGGAIAGGVAGFGALAGLYAGTNKLGEEMDLFLFGDPN